MNYDNKRTNFLLQEVKKKEKFANKYPKLIGPGLIKKIKRILYLRQKYLRYIFFLLGLSKSEVSLKIFSDKKIILPLNDSDALNIYFFGILGIPENKLTKFLIKNLKENDIFYDIGANYGFYSFLAEEIISRGEIHLFEPVPWVFEYAQKNFERNKKVFLNNKAVFKKNETINLFSNFQNQAKKYGSGRSTIFPEAIKENFKDYKKISVPSISLDQYTREHTSPSFMKIDVEGAEHYVLDGAKELLAKKSPVISVEIWGYKEGKDFSKKTIKKLIEMDYKPYFIDEEGDIHAIDLNWFGDFKRINGFDNFIFKK